MKEILNLLNLAEGSTELDIENSIKSLINKKDEMDEDMDEEAMNEYKAKYDELKKSYDEINNELTVIKKEFMDAKAKAEDEKIMNTINASLKMGKIKNESVDSWKTILKSDFENGSKIINELPINKISTKIETKDIQTIKSNKNILAEEMDRILKGMKK